VPKGAMPSLPHVAGEGAATEAAGLFGLLAGHPAVMARVDEAERVGGRRWMLRLADGGIVQLPARGEAEALARMLRIAGARGPEAGEIDVRVAERTLVRQPERRKGNVEREGRTVTGGI
jgi:cell division septal protein FtsQ